MPPKDAKPKKLDAKELEALRLAEEAKKKEEEEKIRLEELKKFEARKLSTGLELIITEYCVQEMWTHDDPKEFVIEFMSHYLTKENLLSNFNKNDLKILAEFHLFNLIFAKEQLHLDENKSMILLNLFWELIKSNNAKYQKGNNKTTPKTREKDYEVFRAILVKHCLENPPENIKYFNGFKKYWRRKDPIYINAGSLFPMGIDMLINRCLIAFILNSNILEILLI